MFSNGYRCLKNTRRKHPDCLADSCKRLSVNRMAAGLRLQVQVMDFSFFHLLFKHALCSQVKGFTPHGLLVYRLCLLPDTPIIFIFILAMTISTLVMWIQLIKYWQCKLQLSTLFWWINLYVGNYCCMIQKWFWMLSLHLMVHCVVKYPPLGILFIFILFIKLFNAVKTALKVCG